MRSKLATAMLAAALAACSPPAPPPAVDAPPADSTAAIAAPAPNGSLPAPADPGAADAGDACDWSRIVLPAHRRRVDAASADLLARLDGAQGDVAQLRSLLGRPAQAPGAIDGDWRIRTLLFDRGLVIAYPFFDARIAAAECGHAIAKTSGSQRFSGLLYPIDGDATRLAFLGATTVNDDPPLAYDPARPAAGQRPGEENGAGALYRIGPDELLMLLDSGDEAHFQVYHLRR